MSVSAPAPMPQPTPTDRAMQIAFGYVPSICLHVAVELKIPDLLAAGPRPVSELAKQTSTNEDALYRILRLLVSLGVFAEPAPRTLALAPPSEVLRSGVPNSVRDLVLWGNDPFHFRVHAELMHSVRTGQPAVEKVVGMPIFDYFPTDPKESAVFNRAMTSFSSMVVSAVLEAYDFSGIHTLVDVAGGHGSVICSVLAKYPQMRGILTDLQHVLDGATECICSHGVQSRVERIACDFFRSVPPGGDAYLMKSIIHDWPDERALAILRNVHTALGAKKGKVILLEGVLPAGPEPHFTKVLDIEMLTFPGGRERSEAEYRALFERAGFRLTRVVPTKSPVCVIEAEKV